MLCLAKESFACHLMEDVDSITTIMISLANDDTKASASTTLQQGWTLKDTRKSYRYNEKQNKFNIGQQTGQKLAVEAVSKDMRHARGDDGTRLFVVSEFLSVEQVASFFSRMASKARNQTAEVTEEDTRAAAEEDNYHQAKEFVISSLGLQHPIIFYQ